MYERLKYRVYDILVETDDNEVIDRVVAVILLILIFVNTAAIVFQVLQKQRFRLKQSRLKTFQKADFFDPDAALLDLGSVDLRNL